MADLPVRELRNATALANGIPVVSQDSDYDDIPGLQVLPV